MLNRSISQNSEIKTVTKIVAVFIDFFNFILYNIHERIFLFNKSVRKEGNTICLVTFLF